MHNLHPGTNLYPWCKFAPWVSQFFCHVNGVIRIALGCKVAPTLELGQIYLQPSANRAHENKLFDFYSDVEMLQAFSIIIL